MSGYALPGIPGAPHFSHTEYCGFGMTHGSADYQDVYIENFRERADGGLEYETEEGWLRAELRTVRKTQPHLPRAPLPPGAHRHYHTRAAHEDDTCYLFQSLLMEGRASS